MIDEVTEHDIEYGYVDTTEVEAAEAKLYDRRTDESATAYAAFIDYCRMGVARSLRALLERYQQQKADESQTQLPPTEKWSTLTGWSVKYQWQERVRQFDDDEAEKDCQIWNDRRRKQREREYSIAEALMRRAEEMLKFPLATTTKEVTEEDTIDGQPVIRKIVTTIQPARWSFKDVAIIAKTASDLVRLAADMPTEHRHISHGVEELLNALPDDFREQVREALIDMMVNGED